MPSLSTIASVPRERRMALWNEVCEGSSVTSPPRFHCRFAYAHTQSSAPSPSAPGSVTLHSSVSLWFLLRYRYVYLYPSDSLFVSWILPP